MKIIKGGVTAPKGFLANGISSGIKRSGKNRFGDYCFRASGRHRRCFYQEFD